MKHPHWIEFIEDTGDCLGGALIGYAFAKDGIIMGIVGAALIAFSLYLKHYKPKT